MYKVYWQSKRKKGTYTIPTPKKGWIKNKKDAREYFYRIKKHQKEFPKTARIVKIV